MFMTLKVSSLAPDFSENFLNKLETFSMRARHITGLAHNELFYFYRLVAFWFVAKQGRPQEIKY